MSKKHFSPAEKIALELTVDERKLILAEIGSLDQQHKDVIQSTPPDKPVMFMLDELENFFDCIIDDMESDPDLSCRNRFKSIFDKMRDLLLPQSVDDVAEQILPLNFGEIEEPATFGEAVAQTFAAAEQYGIDLNEFQVGLALSAQDRVLIANVLENQDSLKNKLLSSTDDETVVYSFSEIGSLCFAISEALLTSTDETQTRLNTIAADIIEFVMTTLNDSLATQSVVTQTHSANVSSRPNECHTLRLTTAQRRTVAELVPDLSDRLFLDSKNDRTVEVTPDELTAIHSVAQRAVQNTKTVKKKKLLTHIVDKTNTALENADSDLRIYQFKISLVHSDHPIWRRIQTHDCTLDDLHFLIQAAMGWENCHLHKFEINKQRYGDPETLGDGFGDSPIGDSLDTRLSGIIPPKKKRFRFTYQYDFGDSWYHEILFEGISKVEKGQKYPQCLDGKRACPPEDVGGVWGYERFLDAINDTDHEDHDHYVDWCEDFDPDAFDLKQANKYMQ